MKTFLSNKSLTLLLTAFAVALTMATIVHGKGKPGDGDPPPPPVELPTFTIEYLGTLGGTWSMTYGMNDFGDVVGASQRADGSSGPFVSTATNEMQDMNLLVAHTNWRLIDARDINNAGQIVGYGYPDAAIGEYISSAYRYTPPLVGELFGTIENLGVPGPNSARATAINNNGDVTGHFSVDGVWHPFLWIDGDSNGYQDLGTLADASTLAWAINDRHNNGHVQVAGRANTTEGMRAWRYGSATQVMQDLGVLSTRVGPGGQPDSYSTDMNNLGDVVGWSSSGRHQSHAFVELPFSGMQDLGTLGGSYSDANGINDSGNIVGSAQSSDGVYRAFAYSTETGMFALDPQTIGLDPNRILDGKLLPWRINSSGQICGPGEDDFNFYNIHGEAYILTPVSP